MAVILIVEMTGVLKPYLIFQVDSCLNWSNELIEHHLEIQTRQHLSRDGLQLGGDECNLEHIYAFTRYVALTGLAATGWFLRMSVDPLIDIVCFC